MVEGIEEAQNVWERNDEWIIHEWLKGNWGAIAETDWKDHNFLPFNF